MGIPRLAEQLTTADASTPEQFDDTQPSAVVGSIVTLIAAILSAGKPAQRACSARVAPMNYLTSWRVQVAARQLRTSDATLAEVADAVGYGSEASFSRAFKRHVGVAPGEWRRT